MQIQGTQKIKKYSGSIDAGMKIFKKHGFQAVQKGWVATIGRDGPFFGLYFMFYEMIARALQGDNGGKITAFQGFLSGGLTGVVSWVITFPLDSLKSISQTEPLNQSQRVYSGYMNMVKTVVQKEGAQKLYNGLLVCTLRGFPVNAVTFLFYEMAKDQIQNLRGK